MYQLVSAVGKRHDGDGRWVDADIGDVSMLDLYGQYTRLIAVLSNPFLPDPVSLDFEAIRLQAAGLTKTFKQYLIDNADNTLPTSSRLPEIKTRYALYCDAFCAGYSVEPVHPYAAPDASLPMGDKTWLFLDKEGVDFEEFRRHCMVTVNGYYHFLDGSAQGAWVVDGMKSKLLSGDATIGITSFLNIGELEYIPIRPDMVYKQDEDQLFRHRVAIKIDEDIGNRTVMLVLGGYLHVMDAKTFRRVGDKQILIDMENLPFIQRYHESMQHIDYSSLPFSRSPLNESALAVAEFMSDENIMAYLTLSQSFIVLLDNPDIFVARQKLRSTKTVGLLISSMLPKYPIVHGLGKACDYWAREENGLWSINYIPVPTCQRAYDTTVMASELAVDAGNVVPPESKDSPGYFLKIGTDV